MNTQQQADHDLIPDEWQKEESEPSKIPPKPEDRDWKTLDLSKGPIKEGIFDDPKAFKAHLKDSLKGLGSMLNATKRKDVAGEISSLRHHGLNSKEVRGKLNEMVEDGRLTHFEAKKIRSKLGAKRSSFF